MRPLLIGPDELAELARVKAYAEAHFVGALAMESARQTGRSPATEPGFRCELPVGFRVAFTIERHPDGWVRHLSASIAGGSGRLPSPAALEVIGRELGMRNDDPRAIVYLEGEPPRAVSVIEPVEPVKPGPPG